MENGGKLLEVTDKMISTALVSAGVSSEEATELVENGKSGEVFEYLMANLIEAVEEYIAFGVPYMVVHVEG